MTPWEIVVFSSISAAVLLWGLSHHVWRRPLWTAAAALSAVHAIAALGLFYGWNHQVAAASTRAQTAALTGLDVPFAIHANYAFLAVWLGDALWWWASPASHAARPGWVSVVVRGFILFMILNGAVLFADGWARVVGLVSIGLAAAGMVLGRAAGRRPMENGAYGYD